jgi:hypothetical protein
MQNLISNHWLSVVIFFISIALFVYVVRSTHSLILKIISGVFLVFMLLVVIGFSMEGNSASNSNGQNFGSEAQRQKATFSNPSMRFFSFLFNDNGSSDPTKDFQKEIEKEFSPQTYFSKNPDLLSLAQLITGGEIENLGLQLKEKPQLAKEVTTEGYSLLHFAALNLNEEAISRLLESKANPNQIYFTGGSSGYTPLTYLLDKYRKMGSAHPDEALVIRIVDLLNKGGAELNIPYASDSSKRVLSPLSYVALDVDWQKNIFKKLVADGANINLGGFRNRTILYDMITISSSNYIKFLLDLDADPNHKSDDGDTPADQYCKLISDMKERGQYNSQKQKVEEIFTALKEKGAILNCEI